MFSKKFGLTALLFLLTLGGFPVPGSAETAKNATLTLDLATQAAQATVEQCEKDGFQVSAAVVDSGGNLKAQLRADGAGPHTVSSSFKKAFTAASLKRSTLELAELVIKIPRIDSLRDMHDNILILGGGLPVFLNGQPVGGIGVGGAPGDKLDEKCAQAGLAKIGATASKGK